MIFFLTHSLAQDQKFKSETAYEIIILVSWNLNLQVYLKQGLREGGLLMLTRATTFNIKCSLHNLCFLPWFACNPNKYFLLTSRQSPLSLTHTHTHSLSLSLMQWIEIADTVATLFFVCPLMHRLQNLKGKVTPCGSTLKEHVQLSILKYVKKNNSINQMPIY